MKENLLRVKRFLEKKCIASNYGVEYLSERYIDIVSKIDNEGAFESIVDYINKVIGYCELNDIDFESMTIYPRFSLYFDSKYEDTYPYVIDKRINPIKDILKITIEGVSYSTSEKTKSLDPSLIFEDIEFNITFDDFKTLIESTDLSFTYNSFDEILNDYRNKKQTVGKITKNKKKNINIKKYE